MAEKPEGGGRVRWLAAVLFFLVLGRIGEMDRRDQEAAEEFGREWMAVHDENGEPRLVSVRGGMRHGQVAVRDVSERAQLRTSR